MSELPQFNDRQRVAVANLRQRYEAKRRIVTLSAGSASCRIGGVEDVALDRRERRFEQGRRSGHAAQALVAAGDGRAGGRQKGQ